MTKFVNTFDSEKKNGEKLGHAEQMWIIFRYCFLKLISFIKNSLICFLRLLAVTISNIGERNWEKYK